MDFLKELELPKFEKSSVSNEIWPPRKYTSAHDGHEKDLQNEETILTENIDT